MRDFKKNIAALRAAMARRGLSACYIPTADYHLSEYVGDHFKFRAWLSGFTGSAGTLVVLPEEAGLWTDSRYFLQAEEELSGTGIDLYKMDMPRVPAIEAFLSERLPAGAAVGLDGRTLATAAGKKLTDTLCSKNITLDIFADLAAEIWPDRPAMSAEPVWIYDEGFAGQSVSDKLAAIRRAMDEKDADAHVMCMLDEIAWLFNLRGGDVDYNPVFLSYAVVEKNAVLLFIDEGKLTTDASNMLRHLGVTLRPYDQVYDYAGSYSSDRRILISPDRLNYALYRRLTETGAKLIEDKNPVLLLKSVKNGVEIAGSRYAHIKDGVAIVRFMKWLKEQMKLQGDSCEDGFVLTEASAAAYLDQLRLDTDGCLGLSFPTISGYGSHGAIVHYAVSEETDAALEPHGLFLVDSGGHYMEGTTDITRTFALGALTSEEKIHFTLVLRCMLNLMNARFPYGVACHNLDVVAHMPLWEQGLDFRHGTGHGVGHLLNVHEGPNNFYWKLRDGASPVILEPGMITTDEPGLYITDCHGIRLENELLCVEKETTEYGRFLGFESLTLAPIDLDAVDPSVLTDEDKRRLNAYHKQVYDLLAPELDEDERSWLAEYTREI